MDTTGLCSSCGAERIAGAKFCPNCGASLARRKDVTPVTPRSRLFRSRTALISLGGALGVVAVVAVAIWAIGRGDDSGAVSVVTKPSPDNPSLVVAVSKTGSDGEVGFHDTLADRDIVVRAVDRETGDPVSDVQAHLVSNGERLLVVGDDPQQRYGPSVVTTSYEEVTEAVLAGRLAAADFAGSVARLEPATIEPATIILLFTALSVFLTTSNVVELAVDPPALLEFGAFSATYCANPEQLGNLVSASLGAALIVIPPTTVLMAAVDAVAPELVELGAIAIVDEPVTIKLYRLPIPLPLVEIGGPCKPDSSSDDEPTVVASPQPPPSPTPCESFWFIVADYIDEPRPSEREGWRRFGVYLDMEYCGGYWSDTICRPGISGQVIVSLEAPNGVSYPLSMFSGNCMQLVPGIKARLYFEGDIPVVLGDVGFSTVNVLAQDDGPAPPGTIRGPYPNFLYEEAGIALDIGQPFSHGPLIQSAALLGERAPIEGGSAVLSDISSVDVSYGEGVALMFQITNDTGEDMRFPQAPVAAGVLVDARGYPYHLTQPVPYCVVPPGFTKECKLLTQKATGSPWDYYIHRQEAPDLSNALIILKPGGEAFRVSGP